MTIDPMFYFHNAVAMLVLSVLSLTWLHIWWTRGSFVHLMAYILAMLIIGRMVWAFATSAGA